MSLVSISVIQIRIIIRQFHHIFHSFRPASSGRKRHQTPVRLPQPQAFIAKVVCIVLVHFRPCELRMENPYIQPGKKTFQRNTHRLAGVIYAVSDHSAHRNPMSKHNFIRADMIYKSIEFLLNHGESLGHISHIDKGIHVIFLFPAQIKRNTGTYTFIIDDIDKFAIWVIRGKCCISNLRLYRLIA